MDGAGVFGEAPELRSSSRSRPDFHFPRLALGLGRSQIQPRKQAGAFLREGPRPCLSPTELLVDIRGGEPTLGHGRGHK